MRGELTFSRIHSFVDSYMNDDDFVPPSNTLLPFVVDPASAQHPLAHPGYLPALSMLGPALQMEGPQCLSTHLLGCTWPMSWFWRYQCQNIRVRVSASIP